MPYVGLWDHVSMSRRDTIRRELQAYLAELDAERERVRAFLEGTTPVLDAEDHPATPPVVSKPTRTEPSDSTPGTSGDALALRVMQERTDVPTWTAPTLLPVLLEAGWSTTAVEQTNAVGAILSRLKRAGKIGLVRRGVYVALRPRDAESPADDTAGLSDLSDDPGEEVIPDGNPAHRDLGPLSDGRLDRGHDHGAPVAG